MYPETELLSRLLDCKAKTVVLQGGTRAQKTWSVLKLFNLRSAQTSFGQRFVVGRDVPFLKNGPIMDMKSILREYPVMRKFMPKNFYNQEDKQFNWYNNSFVKNQSFEDEDDVKMSDFDDGLMNEADKIKHGYKIYRQLLMRSKGQIFIDYNPAAPFWVHDKLIGRDDVQLFITDHRTNQFLPQYRHDEIEKQRLIDPEWWRVYGRGLTGNIQGIVYPNHQIVTEIPKHLDEVIWGIDYGYTNAKTAVLRTIIDRKNLTLYEKACCYQPGLEPEQIKQIMEENGYQVGDPFYSEVDPEMVSQLRRLGMIVNMSIDKGLNSEYNAIVKLRHWQSCYLWDENLNKEYTRCQFEVAEGSSTLDGTATEIITNKVKDTKNFHYMAAKRYSQYTHLFAE